MSCFKEIAVIERKSLSNNAQYFKSLFKIGEFYPISHKKMVDIEDDFERQFQEQELEFKGIQFIEDQKHVIIFYQIGDNKKRLTLKKHNRITRSIKSYPSTNTNEMKILYNAIKHNLLDYEEDWIGEFYPIYREEPFPKGDWEKKINERVLAYYRSATTIQEDRDQKKLNELIETQKRINQAYMEDLGNKIVAEFIDLGYSGTVMDRPEIKEMFDRLRDKEIDGIVVYDYSVLARSSDLLTSILKKIVEEKKILYLSLEKTKLSKIGGTTAFRKTLDQINRF